MPRHSRAIIPMMTTMFLAFWASSDAFGQIAPITITSPANNAVVNIGPGPQPLQVKATIDNTKYSPTGANISWVDAGGVLHIVNNTNIAQDPAFPPNTGHIIFNIYISPGTYTNCIVLAQVQEIAAPANKPDDQKMGIKVIKQP